MWRSSLARWVAGTLAFIALLGVLRYKPWRYFEGPQSGSVLARSQLSVGFLPVT